MIAISCLVLLALSFAALNGMHDCSNAIATIISTRVLSPIAAVSWSAICNGLAFLIFGTVVATTIGKGIIDPTIVDISVIFSALMGAIIWNIITWQKGLPSSSSHALIGGLIGAGIAKVGFNAIIFSGLMPTLTAIILSPTIGFIVSLGLIILVAWVFRKYTPYKVDIIFRYMQLLSSTLVSLAHGGNDAQKCAGIITILLFSQGFLGETFYVPLWVILSSSLAMGIGTLCGGWKIIKTMGRGITELKPSSGFCAETGGAITLFGANYLGIPVSTTHIVAGSIIGVGSIKGTAAVKWIVAKNMVIAWVITIPSSALIAGLFFEITKLF